MRLIDADAIKYEPILDPTENGTYDLLDHVYKGDVESMPTIDAIPIEFIEKHIRGYEEAKGYPNKSEFISKILDIHKRTLADLIKDWAEDRCQQY